MKNWWFGKAKYLEEQAEQEKEDLKNIRWIMDHGTVEQFEFYVRNERPEITDDKMQRLISDFHRYRAEREQELVSARSIRRF